MTKEEIDDKQFAKILLWTLGQATISGNLIHKQFEVSPKRASEFLERLYQFGIIGEKYEKNPREVLPNNLEDLSELTVNFLKQYGFSEDNINDAFNSYDITEKGNYGLRGDD